MSSTAKTSTRSGGHRRSRVVVVILHVPSHAATVMRAAT